VDVFYHLIFNFSFIVIMSRNQNLATKGKDVWQNEHAALDRWSGAADLTAATNTL